MVIDLLNNTLIIEDPASKLKPDQISQIHYWGFVKILEGNIYRLSPKNVDAILTKILKYFDVEKVAYSLSLSCQERLEKLNLTVDKYDKIKLLGHEYKEGIFDVARFDEFLSFVNRNITRRLKDHQLKAAFHLYLIGNGANFSVPGSGKTSVVLCVYEKLRCLDKVNTLFVVGPPGCFGPWRTEFKLTLGRDPDWKVLAGGEQAQRKSEYYTPPSQKAELYLTTFQTLLNDQEQLILFLNQRGINPFIVIDEAHYIKQLNGKWANAVLKIAEYADHKCVLTGTPMPKSYTDIYNLFDFLWPHNNPINSEMKIKIAMHEKNNDPGSVKPLLEDSIAPLFYRVRKSELGLIEPVFHSPYILEMNKYEKMLYNAIENKIRDYSKKDYLRNLDFIMTLQKGRITRLRQCVSYAKLLSSALSDYEEILIDNKSDLAKIIMDYDNQEVPRKIERLIELVEELQDKRQKVVIWSHFIGTLKLIRQHLTKNGLYCKLIYGETPIEQTAVDEEETREKIRDEFVEPRSGLDILIANPAACGESISLHKTCYHSIYYDLSYNCAQYLQSLDRIHRVGGSEVNQANYYFLQYKNTIDQDIRDNLEKKAAKMYDLIEEDYNIYSLNMFEDDDEIEAYERIFGK